MFYESQTLEFFPKEFQPLQVTLKKDLLPQKQCNKGNNPGPKFHKQFSLETTISKKQKLSDHLRRTRSGDILSRDFNSATLSSGLDNGPKKIVGVTFGMAPEEVEYIKIKRENIQ